MALSGRLLTTDDLVARGYGDKHTIERRRARGDGPPFVKIGRLVRYRLEDIEAYERQQTRGSTSEAA